MSDKKLDEVLAEVFGTAPVVRRTAAMGEIRRAAFTPEVRAVDEEKREITFVASTETQDRMQDVIKVSGWELENYLRNPVVLFSHRASDPPVGRTVEIHTEQNPPALVHTVRFADAQTYPFGDQVYRLVKGKFLNSVSVGFRPLEPPERNDTGGYTFTRQELLEISVVPIPAQVDAVARAVGDGIIVASDVEKFFSNAPATPADCERLLASYDKLAESVAARPELARVMPFIHRLGGSILTLTARVRQQHQIRSVAELEWLLRL